MVNDCTRPASTAGRVARRTAHIGRASGSAALLAVVGACSVWVNPDESRLEPRDAGPEHCTDDALLPTVVFPRPNSGVLGVLPVWVQATDYCSGIDSVSVQLFGDDSAAPIEQMPASPVRGERYTAFWDTATWTSGKPDLEAVARPRGHPTVPDQSSGRVPVSIFRFVPSMPSTGATAPMGWAFVDFDRDGDPDLLWGGSLFRNDDGWPYEDVTAVALAAYCELPEAACTDGHHPAWERPTVADLTGDGCMDILGANGGRDQTLWLVEGDCSAVGAGGFWRAGATVPLIDTSPNGPLDLLVADFDLDGWLDVLVTRRCEYTSPLTDCTVYTQDLLVMGVDGRSWEPHGSPADTGLQLSLWDEGAVAGDFLGDDGFPDVIVTRNLGGTSIAYRNRGEAAPPRFERADEVSSLPSNYPAQLADYDRDGDLDIVFPASQAYVRPSLWRNESAAATFVDVSGATGYAGGILADINNDGFLDAGASLGTPDGLFVQTGVSAFGIPFDVDRGRTPIPNPALDFVQGTGSDDVSRSTLTFTGRIVVRVDLQATLPHNRFGIGARIEIAKTGADDFDRASAGPWGRSTAEIGPLWSGAVDGFEAQFGVDGGAEYMLRFRLPTPELPTVVCAGPVQSNTIVTLLDTGGSFQLDGCGPGECGACEGQ
jgi:hypothetical protein